MAREKLLKVSSAVKECHYLCGPGWWDADRSVKKKSKKRMLDRLKCILNFQNKNFGKILRMPDFDKIYGYQRDLLVEWKFIYTCIKIAWNTDGHRGLCYSQKISEVIVELTL